MKVKDTFDFYIRRWPSGGWSFMSPVYIDHPDIVDLGDGMYWTDYRRCAIRCLLNLMGVKPRGGVKRE